MEDQGISLKGFSTGLGAFNDDIYLVHKTLSGSGSVQLKYDAGHDEGTIGTIFRENLETNAKYIALLKYDDSVKIQYRARKNAKSQAISLTLPNCETLELRRVGNNFTFYYSSTGNDTLTSLNRTLSLDLPYDILAGYCISNKEGRSFDVSFNGIILGKELDTSSVTSCEGFEQDFDRSSTLYDAGFDSVSNWSVDSGFAYTATEGGILSPAILYKDSLLLKRDSSAVSISFDIYFDSINSGFSNSNLFNSVLCAKDSLVLGSGAYIVGTELFSNGALVLGPNVQVRANVKALNVVNIKNQAHIWGNIYTQNLVQEGTYAHTGIAYLDTLLSPMIIPAEDFSIGTQDVTISSSQGVQSLNPGAYGSVTIGSNCQVSLTPGAYYMDNLVIHSGAGIVIDGSDTSSIDLFVKNDLSMLENSHVTITYGVDYHRVKFYCANQSQVTLAKNVLFSGALIAPFSKVVMGKNAQLHGGGIYANTILVDTACHIYKYGDSVTTDVKGLEPDMFEVSLGDSSQEYKLQIKPSIDSLPGKGILSLALNNVVLVETVIDSLPEKKWLKCMWELFPGSAEYGPAGQHFFVDVGSGYKQLFSTQEWYLNSIRNLGFKYQTSPLPLNNSVRLDNIETSCDENSCDYISIVEQPSDTTIFEDSLAILRVVPKDNTGIAYQWFRDGDTLTGETNDVLVLKNAVIGSNSYSCLLLNYCDTIMSNSATVTVVPCENPIIVKHPQNYSSVVGGTANFYVTAQGEGLQYQWKKNGYTLSGETKSVLFLDSLSLENSYEQYSVIVSNGCGKKVISNTATLEVEDTEDCSFLSHPSNDTLLVGDSYTAQVNYSCEDVTYQWCINGLPVSGANGPFYKTPPLTLSNSGDQFYCIVTGSTGTDTSEIAEIVVVKPLSGSKRISVTGMLTASDDDTVSLGHSILVDCKVNIFTKKIGGETIYSEFFEGSRAVVVKDGQFTVTLGSGRSNGNLSSIVNKHSGLYAELYAKYNKGRYELLSDRLPLSASPFAMNADIVSIKGGSSPVVENISAIIGTIFIGIDNSSVWIMTESGWKQIN